jgi:hypothetical protein
VWSVDALWPATTAIVGVYDHPPPDGSGLSSTYLSPETIEQSLWQRELVKTAEALTRARDKIQSWLP